MIRASRQFTLSINRVVLHLLMPSTDYCVELNLHWLFCMFSDCSMAIIISPSATHPGRKDSPCVLSSPALLERAGVPVRGLRKIGSSVEAFSWNCKLQLQWRLGPVLLFLAQFFLIEWRHLFAQSTLVTAFWKAFFQRFFLELNVEYYWLSPK